MIALTRGDSDARELMKAARSEGADIVVPPVVLTQTVRGGPRDATVHQVLRFAYHSFVGARLASRAGELLGMTGLDDAADAQVMAEAMRVTPSVVLTSDPDDMRALAGGRRDIRIVAV